MPRRLRPIGHSDRLSIVDHLDELRSRVIVCLSVLVVVFGVCFAESPHLLDVLNAPLTHLSKTARNHISGVTGDQVGERKHLLKAASKLHRFAVTAPLPTSDRQLIAGAATQINDAAQALPSKSAGPVPVTLGPGEPFTTTITVCLYAALLLCLPLLLYEAFAFVTPALTPREKSVALPIMWAAPLLFFVGVVFTDIVVLPAAIKFLQGYNAAQYQALTQAKPLYSFEVLTMGAIGLTFEMPLVLLGLRALGLIDGSTLTKHWRYAAVIMAVVVAMMPGADPVTTALEGAPLVALFLVSIVLLKIADRRAARRAATQDVARPGVS
jgi:sec-independent protein translocase protein TatC